MTFKHAIAPALVAASVLTMASAASAAPAMTGRPDLASVAQNNDVTRQYRRGYHRGNAAAAAGIGVAAGALIGAAAGELGQQPILLGTRLTRPYRSYNYYEPAPTYYEPAPTYYYGEPAYGGSYGYSTGRRIRSAEQHRCRAAASSDRTVISASRLISRTVEGSGKAAPFSLSEARARTRAQ